MRAGPAQRRLQEVVGRSQAGRPRLCYRSAGPKGHEDDQQGQDVDRHHPAPENGTPGDEARERERKRNSHEQ
eukprot:10329571-Lingulodinium_polyedra.AAC.1